MKIKFREDDFLVSEIPFVDIEGKSGKYSYFLLKKKDRNTVDVVNEVCRRLRIDRKSIGFAGNKDKKAVTSQYISILTNDFENIEKLDINNASLKFVGYGSERINLGDLKGNKFEIIVRQLSNEKELILGKVKNYFGEQRFGKDNLNVKIGKNLIKKEFKKVCELLDLDADGNNFVEAVRKIDMKLLRLYVNAYQSWIWNKVVKEINNLEEIEVIGFLTEFENEIVREKYEEIMIKEDILKEDFLVKQIKEISMEGTTRKLFMNVRNFFYNWSNDELFEGKKKCTLFFELDKGCYATVVLEALFH